MAYKLLIFALVLMLGIAAVHAVEVEMESESDSQLEVERSKFRNGAAVCARDEFASKNLKVRSVEDDEVKAAAYAGMKFLRKAMPKAKIAPAHGNVPDAVAHVESWSIENSKCGDNQPCSAYFISIDLSVDKSKVSRWLLEVTETALGHQLNRYERVVPVDCQVSAWSLGTQCSAQCGGGSSVRSRCVTVRPLYGGKSCPSLHEEVPCNTQKCPVDCQVSSWNAWSSCSKKCGGGVKTRSRKVLVQPLAGGKACPALTESEVCNQASCLLPYSEEHCVSNAQMQQVSVAGNLTSPKVIAQATRAFQLLKEAQRDQPFTPASGSVATSLVDVTTWAVPNAQKHVYVTMLLSLDGSTSSRFFIEIEKGATAAEDRLVRYEMVSKVSCQVSDWNPNFTPCSRQCGGGVRSRWRCVTQLPKFGGNACPSLFEVQICNTKAC
jgi:hypothetical protein